jgi:2-polyprenyl-6-methoxyphenol hydroxylase-like FAD-dependent oxidoreductase
MSELTKKSGAKAIVIGASMGGLMAARALADHFDEVILLERDILPPPGTNRKGVPQGKHTHLLLERGREIMEGYLPGLTDDLTQLGAVTIADASSDVRWFKNGGFHQPGVSNFSAIGVSRPTLEAAVRERVLALPNVRIIQGCKVLGLAASTDNRRVTGVHLVRDQNEGRKETMLADLVVDSSGRGSRSPVWLETLGYKQPEVEEVRIGMGYTTCYYRRQPEHIPGLQSIVYMPTPPNKRLGVLLPQDGNRWVVTLGGYLGDHAPTDYPGFLDTAKELPTPDIYNVIKDAEPLGAPVRYTFPANLRHRYDKLADFPKGFIVFGDALCSFNPIYGQGMTVAAMEAVALGECLSYDRDQLAKRFFLKSSKIIDQSWMAAVGNDLNYPEIEGPRTPMVRLLNWYIDKLHTAALNDAQVSIAFLKTINMIAPPTSMMQPKVVWRVIKGNLRSSQEKDSSPFPILNRDLAEE